jgi:hypothetical protein
MPSNLDMELQRMWQQGQQQQRRPAPRVYAPVRATEAPKMNNKITLNAGGQEHTLTLDMLQSPEGRAAIREVLALRIADIRADRAHPYNDAKHPDHAAAVRDMNDAYRFNNYEMPDTEIAEMASKLTSTITPAAPSAPAEPFREIAQIAGSREGKIALQRRDTGQPLDPQQTRLVARHDELLALNNTQARKEQASANSPKPLNTYIGRDVMAFATNQNKVQRQQLAAEHRAKVLGDTNHPYWNASSTEHKAAVVGMKIATQMMQTGDSDVHIGPDGTIEE